MPSHERDVLAGLQNLGELGERGHLFETRLAGGRPEIEHHGLAAVIGEVDFAPLAIGQLEIRERGGFGQRSWGASSKPARTRGATRLRVPWHESEHRDARENDERHLNECGRFHDGTVTYHRSVCRAEGASCPLRCARDESLKSRR